jgi:hypothetical protein
MGKTFGCDTSGLSWGVGQKHSVGTKADVAKCRDEDGKVTDEQAYSVTETEKLDFVLNGDPPRAGTKYNLGGSSKLAIDANVDYKNDGYAEGSITTERSDDSTQVEYDAPST